MPVATPPNIKRLKLAIRGAVQGVGFRPFVYRLAADLRLAGWVNNNAQGVFIEIEGPAAELDRFLLRLEPEKPPRSFIQSLEVSWLDAAGYGGFEIRESETGGHKTALVLPDIATCPDCLREILDPNNRRYRYPFTNCTNCGPRFSIIESLPYDRGHTSMKSFTMCPQCQAEYEDPRDRRFHAQPNACPVCGPHLELWDRDGRPLACGRVRENAAVVVASEEVPRSDERGHEALLDAAEAIRQGRVVAVKGLGGFHLMVDARNEEAVRRLRERKHREEKPLALMFPTMESVKQICEVSLREERLLRSPESPIVLLKRIANRQSPIVQAVAPGNPHLGVMLPYTPLHHLLMAELGFPVVATSGNLSDEPICIAEPDALERLGDIADLFLVHNRPIVRHVDDSIVRVMLGRELVLRRARGYAPLPITLNAQLSALNSQPVLAAGAHLKNTVALSVGPQVFISQHIGDLETEPAFAAFERVIADFKKLYDVRPDIVAADLHPDYLSTKFAHEVVSGLEAANNPQRNRPLTPSLSPGVGGGGTSRLVGVQHHYAHVLACMAENELEPPVLGVSWDGTGYGLDGAIWGGEFLLVDEAGFERVAHLRPFRLPGGDRAVKEPRRTALGMLYELFGESAFARRELLPVAAFSPSELGTLKTMLQGGVNAPWTTSAGRLFDAVASLAGLRQVCRFEGQAAMELEFALGDVEMEGAYPLPLATGKQAEAGSAHRKSRPALVLDWAPMVEAILADLERAVPISNISAKFHNSLVEAIISVARRIGEPRVALTGGCFQNRRLTERAVERLQEAGFRPYWHQRVPPNDGGIALGQVVAALRQNR